MYLGRVVEQGDTEEVLYHAKHPYTRALLSVVPEVERVEAVVLSGETPDPTRVPAGCRFHPRCPALLGGEAAAAGIEEQCVATPLAVLPARGGHSAACHLHPRP
jgi:peptide/nickel transport system ATP-binding protein